MTLEEDKAVEAEAGSTTETVGPAAARPIRRPDTTHLLWYVMGGSLPERHWTWVLHDLTCRTWAIRQLGRPLVLLVPFAAAYIAFVPGALGLRLITGLTWSGGVMLYMFVNMLVDNDRRAVRAGYVSGYVSDVRSHRADESHHLAVVERNARAARRRASRARSSR